MAAAAIAAGLSAEDVIAYADAEQQKESLFSQAPTCGASNYRVCTNKIILPRKTFAQLPPRFRKIKGDVEWADGRTEAEAEDALDIVSIYTDAGFDFFFYPIRIDQPSIATYSGLTRNNLWKFAARATWFGIPVWRDGKTEDLVEMAQRQLPLLTGPDGSVPVPYGKLVLIPGVGAPGQEITDAQARALRQMIVDQGWAGVDLWNLYAQVGGDISRRAQRVIGILSGLIP